jgi:hypothetical protein
VVESTLIIINNKKLILLPRVENPLVLVVILTEWSDVFEWLWDLSEGQLSKVGHDWLLGKLHELLFGLEAKSTILLESVLKMSNMSIKQIWPDHFSK